MCEIVNSKPVYRNVSVLFLVVFVTDLLGVGGGLRVWMLMVEAAHMLACFLLWRFVKEKPQTFQVYMAEQTLVKHK